MVLEDALGLVLREVALELAAAVDALEVQAGKLGHVGPVHANAADVFRGSEERLKQADGIKDLQGAGLDHRGASLVVRACLPLDEPRPYAVAGELGGGEHPRGSGADDQNVVVRHGITPGSQPSGTGV